MPEDLKTIRGERDTLRADNARLNAEVKKLKEDFAQQQNTLHELMAKTGYKLKQEYQYKEGECRPVHLNDVCITCGFDNRPGSPTYHMKPGDKGKSAHAIL